MTTEGAATSTSTLDAANAAPTERPIAAKREGTLAGLLDNTAFRRLWAAQLLAQLGEAVALVAMPLLVYALTGSAELLSLIFVLQLAPRVLLAPIAGMVVDRFDRKRLIIAADLARAGLVLLLPFATSAWQVAVVATFVAIGNTISRPAELAALPMVVPPNQLVPAMAAAQVAGSVVRIIGPVLAAGIVAFAGPGPAFMVQAVCFVLSAIILTRMSLPPVTRQGDPDEAKSALRREIVDGIRIVAHNPIVRGTALVEALWQLVSAGMVVALLVYVEQMRNLDGDSSSVYSFLIATLAAGMAVGSLVARPVERGIGRPLLMGIGYLAPLMLISASLRPPLPVLFACWFILGFTDAWAVIAMQTYLAEAVPDGLRGRAYAGWTGVVTFGAAIAFTIVGQLTPRLGPSTTLGLIGFIVGFGGPILLLVTGAFRAIRVHSAGGLTQTANG